MRFVSPFLKHVVYPSLAGAGYFRSVERPGLAVITYHGVLPPNYQPIDQGFDGSLISAKAFRQQLRLLKRKYTVITPEEMLSWCRNESDLPDRATLLTCDDGFLNNVTEMLPILQDEGLRCLFFVTGSSLGSERTMLWYEEFLLLLLRAPGGDFRISSAGLEISGVLGPREHRHTLWWNAVRQLSQVDADRRANFLQAAHSHFRMERTLDYYLANYAEAQRHFCLMTRAEVQQLAAAGMTIGAHTVTHPVMAELPPERAWTEILESRAGIESVIGKKVWAFAYPFGNESSVSARVVAMVKQAKFNAAFLNTGGGLGAELPLHAIPRVHVNAGMTLAEFEAHASGFYGSLQRRVGRSPQVNLRALEAYTPDGLHIQDPVSKAKTA